jgi:Hemerythrin HHE cation binding domain
MPDVFEVLGAAHRDLEQMLNRIQALIAAPAELRDQGGSLADTLISAMSQHEAAEEQYFWPAVKQIARDGDSLAAGGIEQETEGKKVLAELDGMAPDHPRFVPLITKFDHAARSHIDYEEQQVWPGLRAALPADEAYRLGAKLARAAQAGPTRPHPHTPPGPAVLKVVGPGIAALDKLRDAASARDN